MYYVYLFLFVSAENCGQHILFRMESGHTTLMKMFVTVKQRNFTRSTHRYVSQRHGRVSSICLEIPKEQVLLLAMGSATDKHSETKGDIYENVQYVQTI